MPENTRAMRGDARGGRRAPKNDNPLIILVSMPYEVQTPVFEGPFDLLLHLILQEQVDLYEVSLSTIVDSYLRELERMDELELDRASDSLLIAATLVELKSRRLLPTADDLDLDEELAVWEERDLLLHRLVECKTFKEAAIALQVLAGEAGRSHPRTVGVDDRFVGLMPDLLEGIDAEDIRRAYLRAMVPRTVPRIDLDHVAPIRVSVTDAIGELVQELPQLGRTTFRALTCELVERLQVVVRFLAVLELFKKGLVDIEQPRTFGDIEIVWLGEDGARELGDLGGFDTVDAYDG